VALVGCHDSTRPGGADADPTLVSLAAVCHRRFEIANGNPGALTVRYEVSATGETGELTLSGHSSGASTSATRLVTLTDGDVRLSYRGTRIAEASAAGSACAAPVATAPQPMASVGEWSAPFGWPVVAVHLHLLPDGRVLSWGRIGTPQIWDPATGAFTEAATATDVFCAGHAFLPDGRLLVAGGHISDFHGLPDANTFDPLTDAWSAQAPMAHGRWYPTVTTLADGRAVVLGGQDEGGVEVAEPERWDDGRWTPLTGASLTLANYPRTFVAPNGLLFYAGELRQSRYLDPTGAGGWTPVAASLYGRRDYGSAVMYEPGKVLIAGGSDPPDGPPTATAETIDLTAGAAAWRYTSPMAFPRRHLNLTLLPDGRTVATGGTSTGGFSDLAGAVHAAEVLDPASGAWLTWASDAVSRVYHSTTLLLPDGRLLHAGGGDGANLPRELNAELFTPPYLLHGARPTIAAAPASVSYGRNFQVDTPDAGAATRVTLVRLPSVTHAFDESQRFVPLPFARSAGGLRIAAPASGAVAPPGHYMLFLLDADGIPSIARIVRLQ
jgi:galactose oxidase